jgi:hypothetical protein
MKKKIDAQVISEESRPLTSAGERVARKIEGVHSYLKHKEAPRSSVTITTTTRTSPRRALGRY